MDFIEQLAEEREELIRQWNEEERLKLQECQQSAEGCNPYPEGWE